MAKAKTTPETRNDKFVWKKGDVKIYKSEAEWRKVKAKKGKV